MKRYIKAAILPVADEDYGTKLELAQNPATTLDVLDEIYHSADSNDYKLLCAILSRTDIPVEWLIESIQNDDSGILEALANPNLPIEYIEEYSNHSNYFRRIAIAENPSTPPALLVKMATTPIDQDDKFVLRRIAENPNTPVNILKQLANSTSDEWTRLYALRNPNATEEMHQMFDEEFHKSTYLSVDVTGADVDMDGILSDICREHNVNFYGSFSENISYAYPEEEGAVSQYTATMGYIFESDMCIKIEDAFKDALADVGCYVLGALWGTYDE